MEGVGKAGRQSCCRLLTGPKPLSFSTRSSRIEESHRASWWKFGPQNWRLATCSPGRFSSYTTHRTRAHSHCAARRSSEEIAATRREGCSRLLWRPMARLRLLVLGTYTYRFLTPGKKRSYIDSDVRGKKVSIFFTSSYGIGRTGP